MSSALIPSPPRALRLATKGIEIDPTKWNDALRSEAITRRELETREATARKDVEFLIAVGRTEYRKLAVTPHPENNERCARLAKLDLLLFNNSSPQRDLRAREARQTTAKIVPVAWRNLQDDEEQLREWLQRVEEKLRTTIAAHERQGLLFETRLPRCSDHEAAERAKLCRDFDTEWKRLVKQEFVDRPPYVPVSHHVVERSFDEEEGYQRSRLQDEETVERTALHEWLVLRYGVQLFSVNRVEDIARQEIEDDLPLVWSRTVFSHLQQSYRASMLSLCAFHGRPSRTPLVALAALATQ
jgi:hypothetical protein